MPSSVTFKHIFSSDRNFDKIKNKKIQKIKIIQPFSYNIKRKREKIRTKNNICIFDYNPSKKPYLLDNKDYEYIQFGSEKSQLKFIKSILKVVNKINKNRKNIVHCYIKRQITPGRNLLHLKSIHTLKKEYKNFHILNPQISIEDNFQFFQTVISYPNTSPSIYYSKITGKDSFYYDVENVLQNKYDKNITLIKSENLLEKRLNKIFKSYD